MFLMSSDHRLLAAWRRVADRLSASPAATSLFPRLLLPLIALVLVCAASVYAMVWMANDQVSQVQGQIVLERERAALSDGLARETERLIQHTQALSPIDDFMVAYYDGRLDALFAAQRLEDRGVDAALILIPDGSILFALQSDHLSGDFANRQRLLLERAMTNGTGEPEVHFTRDADGSLIVMAIVRRATQSGSLTGALGLVVQFTQAELDQLAAATELSELKVSPGAVAVPEGWGSLPLGLQDLPGQRVQLVWPLSAQAVPLLGDAPQMVLIVGGTLVLILLGLYAARLRTLALDYDAAIYDADAALAAREGVFAQMHHELRTPLNHLLGYTEMMRARMMGPLTPMQTDALETVEHSGRLLKEVLDNILHYQSMEGLDQPRRAEPVDVLQTCQSVLRTLKATAERRRISLVLQRLEAPRLLLADAADLKHAILAVVGNALKFSPDGARISVTARFNERACILSIADDGPGMEPLGQLKARSAFTSFDPLGSDGQPRGLGLGLCVVQHLMTLHGGRLRIDSQPGEGTIVQLIFPAERVGALVDSRAENPETDKGESEGLVQHPGPLARHGRAGGIAAGGDDSVLEASQSATKSQRTGADQPVTSKPLTAKQAETKPEKADPVAVA